MQSNWQFSGDCTCYALLMEDMWNVYTVYSVERGIDNVGRLLDIFGLGEGVATSKGCANSRTPEQQQI